MSVYIDQRQTFSERQSLTTLDFLSLRRRWKLVGSCVAVSVALGLSFIALRPPSYTASTQLLIYVKEVQPGPDLVISLGRADLTQVENESEIIRSRGSLAKVVRSLNLTDDPEFAPATTPLRKIMQWLSGPSLTGEPRTASDEGSSKRGVSQDTAQDAAQSLAQDVARDLAVESLARQVTVKRVGTSHTVLVSVKTSDPDKSARIANAIGQALIQGRAGGEQGGDRSPMLRERLQGLGPSAYLITPALAPDRPDGPRKILVMLAAIMAGSMIGSALALLLDFKDRTIRTAGQVENLGLECIGAIPLLKSRRVAASSRSEPGKQIDGDDDPLLPVPLQQQTLLRATVALEAAGARIVGIASPTAGEGATTVARQFARIAARSQRKVLLVEGEAHFGPAEPSDPQLQPSGGNIRSGAGNGPDVLAASAPGDKGGADWRADCGRTALAAYDLIVVSLPPLESGAEFRMVARTVDGVLLVMKWGGVEMVRIERAFAISGAASSDFIGAVLNMVDDRMIGLFGDKFWKAEVLTAARRRLFSPATPTHPVARHS